MNESELVARIRTLFSPRIGDDAAVIGQQVFTADMLVEDVDFLPETSLRLVGRKSIAVNLSDLAAMGAAPDYALVSIALPDWVRTRVDDLLEGIASAAREHRIEIVGGDLSRGAKLTVAVTAIGHVVTRPLLRSGARAGDRIFVSRPIGASAAGLSLLTGRKDLAGMGYADRELVESVLRRHLDPEPEVELGLALAAIPEVTACIDVSDGLSTDIHHLCRASSLGATIAKERIPVFPDLGSAAPRLGLDLRRCVLDGGEEYALLFTASLRESELSRRVGRPVYAIGRMTGDSAVVLTENGEPRPLLPEGWDHFRPA